MRSTVIAGLALGSLVPTTVRARELGPEEREARLDAGDSQIQRGRRIARIVQAREKVVQSFSLETTSSGGHSSLPTRDNPIYRLVTRTTAALWPGVPIVPIMETGATDGKYLRSAEMPTYGVWGVFIDIDEVRAHGRDERIGVQDFYDGLAYIRELVRAISGRQS